MVRRMLGDDKSVEYETRTIAALIRLFASDRYAATDITSDEPDENAGLCLDPTFAGDISIGIAYGLLEARQPDQARVLKQIYGERRSRRFIAETSRRGHETVGALEMEGLTQLIRWLFDEDDYQPVHRLYKRPKTKETQEYKDWLRYRDSAEYQRWIARRKRRMGV